MEYFHFILLSFSLRRKNSVLKVQVAFDRKYSENDRHCNRRGLDNEILPKRKGNKKYKNRIAKVPPNLRSNNSILTVAFATLETASCR